ncbi:PAS domain S-box-containing protein [Acidovorax soli]|uniref:histidine kinase n=1 Tax=Acidovorax soli TaxID=592050 RepID=A0A7X0UBA5_9BURK|nr:ATP-binding protein [Acidovorax soli]MBB6561749.1 PAS domain S-box-containing protein [Acidovorax soli]
MGTQAPPRFQQALRALARVRRSVSALALASGLLLTVAVAVATTLVGLGDRANALRWDQEKAELLARMLEDQTTRTVEGGIFALGALAETAALRKPLEEPAQTETALRQALAGTPYLRAIAVVDIGGRVIASSLAGEAELAIQVEQLGPVPSNGGSTIGPFLRGRGLASLARDAPDLGAPGGLGFIPLVRGYADDTGRPLQLVGLLNPDSLANRQQLAVGEEGFGSAIASYDGEVLVSSGIALAGRDLAALPVFRDYLPGVEHASYVGAGMGGARQIVAFRASRTQPLVVVVEESHAVSASRWLRNSTGFLYVGAAASALLLLLTLVAWRSLRARETARLLADQAQARIAHSERELAVLMRSVQELIFRTDADSVITFVNARWAALSGGNESAAIGRLLPELVDEQDRSQAAQLFERGGQGGVRTCQARIQLGTGRRLLFDVAVVPLLENGRVLGFAGSAVDVTERWAAQRNLQNQLEFRDLMLQMNPLPISLTDMDSRIVLVNRAWEEYQGRQRKHVVGLRLEDFLPIDEAMVHARADRMLLQQGGQVQFETRILHGDCSLRDTRVTKAVVFNAQGEATGILCTLMDVTDFREAERVTQEARDAAEEASRTKSEFVANMSHELRTPLQSIIGFSELGLLRAKADARLSGMFEDIHRSGERMLNLVNDLLDVAKIESTVGTFHLERLDLRGVIRPVLRELEPLLAPGRLHLDVRLGEVPLIAKVDPVRFQQVVRNILANAIRFSPEGSAIQLLGRVDSIGQIRLAVRDYGPGIPPGELQSIFEAFRQSSKTKDGSGGTGLGLAICQRIVEAMGGQIYAENAPGRGSVFHVVLPARGSSETISAAL